MTDDDLMSVALEEAHRARTAGEVPVGAIVVFRRGAIVGRGQNRVLRDLDPTAHAEIVALRAAARNLDNYRLTECELYVTLEPCSMCAGAMVHARLGRLIYAATDPKAGAVHSVFQILNHPSLNHRMAVTSGPLSEESGAMLRGFFARRRPQPSMWNQDRSLRTTDATDATTALEAAKPENLPSLRKILSRR